MQDSQNQPSNVIENTGGISAGVSADATVPNVAPITPVETSKEITPAEKDVFVSDDPNRVTPDADMDKFFEMLKPVVELSDEEKLKQSQSTVQPVNKPENIKVVDDKPIEKPKVEENADFTFADLINGKSFKEEVLGVDNKPVTPSNEAPVTPVDTPSTFTPEKENAYIAKIQDLESRLVAFEELKRNPYEYFSKHIPGIIVNQFNEGEYVKAKLREEGFETEGENAFVPNQLEIHQIGTPSWKYNQLQIKYFGEAESVKANAIANAGNIEAATPEQLNIKREEIQSKYNLTPSQFDTIVWKQIEGKSDTDILEVLTEAILAKQELAYVKQNIKRYMDRVNGPPSPVTETTNSKSANQSGDPLGSIFGTRAREAGLIN